MSALILKFSAPWCGSCKQISQVILANFSDKEIKEIDIEEQPEIADKYNVMSLPTLLKIDENEIEIERLVGAVNITKLKNFFT